MPIFRPRKLALFSSPDPCFWPKTAEIGSVFHPVLPLPPIPDPQSPIVSTLRQAQKIPSLNTPGGESPPNESEWDIRFSGHGPAFLTFVRTNM